MLKSKLVYIILLGILLIQMPMVSAAVVEIECDYPGQYAEAGDTVTFDIEITNSGDSEKTYNLQYNSYKTDGWAIKFKDGARAVSKIYIQNDASAVVTLEVETPGDAEVGEYPIYVKVGDGQLKLYVEITKTHKGEKGTLVLTVTDKDGDNLKGATISIYGEEELIDQAKTTVEGKIELKLEKGEYKAKITKEGYYAEETEGFKIRIGGTTDIGIFSLGQKEFFAEVTTKSPSKTDMIGKNPFYQIKIKNSGKTDDTYKLDLLGLPEEWYYRYKETVGSNEDISGILVSSGEEKTLYLEFIPPYDVEVGEHNFTVLVESSTEQYELDLSLKLRGSYNMSLYYEKLRYDIKKGDTASMELIVSNSGLGGTITNIKPGVSAPSGWNARLSPKEVASLKPGESETFTIKITPPGDIETSDYKVTVNVKSDQLAQEEIFRIIVKESSNVPLYGALIIIVVVLSLFFVFRKFGRR